MLSFPNDSYTIRSAFLIRIQRIYFHLNRVKTNEDIKQMLYIEQVAKSRAGPGPAPVRPSRSGPAQAGPGPRTYRVGPGRPQGRGPPALPVDSLLVVTYIGCEVAA